MESAGFRHCRFPSSDRFLGIFSAPPPSSSSSGPGTELIEAEIFWTTGDFSEPADRNLIHLDRTGLRSGILAVLPDRSDHSAQVLRRKASVAPSAAARAIPRPPTSQDREFSRSLPMAAISAPVNVPLAAIRRKKNLEAYGEEFEEEEDEEEEKVLPPHEMAARGSGVSPMTTFSVLEGVGRTLKGRDLRQVRNAIWRRTGFLD